MWSLIMIYSPLLASQPSLLYLLNPVSIIDICSLRGYLMTNQFKMLLGYSSYWNLSNIYSSGRKNLACNLRWHHLQWNHFWMGISVICIGSIFFVYAPKWHHVWSVGSLYVQILSCWWGSSLFYIMKVKYIGLPWDAGQYLGLGFVVGVLGLGFWVFLGLSQIFTCISGRPIQLNHNERPPFCVQWTFYRIVASMLQLICIVWYLSHDVPVLWVTITV